MARTLQAPAAVAPDRGDERHQPDRPRLHAPDHLHDRDAADQPGADDPGDAAVRVEEPAAASRTRATHFVAISVDAKGNTYLDERPTPIGLAELRSRLRLYAAETKPPVIRIRGDARVPYEKIVQVMDELKQVNLLKFTFDTQCRYRNERAVPRRLRPFRRCCTRRWSLSSSSSATRPRASSRTNPKVFELVAGAGDNYTATAAPALGRPAQSCSSRVAAKAEPSPRPGRAPAASLRRRRRAGQSPPGPRGRAEARRGAQGEAH